MANFDAGTIEATLILDRSPFTEGLRLAKAQADRFERDAIEPRLDIDTAGAMAELAALDALADVLDGRRIALDVDLDTGGAAAELAALQALLEMADKRVRVGVDVDMGGSVAQLAALESLVKAVSGDTITLNVDLDAGSAAARLAALQAQVDALDGREIDVDADFDRDGSFGRSLGRGSAGVGLLATALLGLAPLAVPLLAGVTAGVVALGGSLAGAAGGVGILAAGFIGAVKAWKEMDEAARMANERVALFTTGIERIQQEWAKFVENTQDDAFQTMGVALGALADAMPEMHGLFHLFNEVLREAMVSVQEFVNGGEFDRMIEFFGTRGVTALEQFLRIGGNLLLFFGRLFEAFGPFTDLFITGLADMTARWAEWADGLGATQGFQDFIEYVTVAGPMFLDMLGSLFDALINIGVALAPLALPLMSGLTTAFDYIANMDPNLLTNLALGIGAVVAGLRAWSMIQPVLNLLLAANPIGLVVLAVAALAAGLVIAYRESEAFRDIVDGVWKDVQESAAAFQAYWEDVLWPAVQQVWEQIKDAFGDGDEKVSSTMTGLMNLLDQVREFLDRFWEAVIMVWNFGIDVITTAWRVFGENILDFITDTIDNVLQVFEGLFEMAEGLLDMFIGAFTGDWDQFWDGVLDLTTGFGLVLGAILDQVWTGIKFAAKNFGTALWELMEWAWGQVKDEFWKAKDDLGRVAGELPGAVLRALNPLSPGLTGAARTAWEAFRSATGGKTGEVLSQIRALPGQIVSAMGSLGGLLVNAGRSILDGLISGVRDRISDLRNTLGGITDMIPSWKGPAERDASLLRPAGRLIMGGLVSSIEDQIPDLERTLGHVTDVIAGMQPGPGMSGQYPGAFSAAPGAALGMDAASVAELIKETSRTREAMEALAQEYKLSLDNQLLLTRTGAIKR